MKGSRKLTFASFAAVALTLLVQNPIARAAQAKGPKDDKHTLRLRVYFQQVAGPTVPQFGDQFTIAGPVARFETPNQIIGRIALQIVATAPFATETLLYGVLNLPDGQISFTGLSPTQEPRIPGPITGGTGAYRGAKGEVAHLSPAPDVEELILTFDGD